MQTTEGDCGTNACTMCVCVKCMCADLRIREFLISGGKREVERGEFIEPALTAQADAAAVLMSVRTTPSTN